MSRHELLVVIVRLFAIGLALSAISQVPKQLATLEAMPVDSSYWMWTMFAAYAVLGLVALFLWQFPFAIASLLLPKQESAESVLPWTPQSTIETATVVIGIFYLFYAVSDFVYWLLFFVALLSTEPGPTPVDPDVLAGIITTVVELIVALFLVFGARAIARFIHAARYSGRAS